MHFVSVDQKELHVRNSSGLLTLMAFLLLTAPLFAQDTPVGPEGTSVATEATPAAAVNTDALRKAAQNPVASLISVPVLNKNNFGIDPGYRTQDVLNIQPVIPVKVSDNWNMIIRWITPNHLSATPCGGSRASEWVGTFPQALYDEAKAKGWTVISMKNDWKQIFAWEK
jgi:hypothetical protein